MPKPIVPIFRGKVDSSHSLRLEFRSSFLRYLMTFPTDTAVDIIVRKQTRQRSKLQNDYYWGVVMSMICDETGSDRDSVHEFCRRSFLRKRGKEIYVNNYPDRLDVRDEIPSTTELTTVQFISYTEYIKQWAAQFLGMYIPDPQKVE